MRNELNDIDIAAFAPSEKVGLVASLTDSGEPHITILSTLMARGAKELTIGEFSRGQSKRNMARNGKVGFLVMGLDRRLWRGKAVWKRLAKEGEEYIAYNRQPMFRYNTYFGINTVHYLDLVGIEGPNPLPMGAIVLGSLATALKSPASRAGTGGPEILPPPALAIINDLASLNFLATVDTDGFPRIVPIIQARSPSPSRIVFSRSAWKEELGAIPDGARAAVLSMNLDMESFMACGSFIKRAGGGLSGVEIDYLYDSAPPCHGQVYPHVPLEAVRE
jgi:hypothetical protein